MPPRQTRSGRHAQSAQGATPPVAHRWHAPDVPLAASLIIDKAISFLLEGQLLAMQTWVKNACAANILRFRNDKRIQRTVHTERMEGYQGLLTQGIIDDATLGPTSGQIASNSGGGKGLNLMKRWKTLDSQLLLECPWLSLTRQTCQRPGGAIIDDYYIIREPDVGCVFALTPDRQVVLVEQYKHGVGEVCLELPAGYFVGKGDPIAQARREFVEETGYDAATYHYVGALPQHPTRLTSRIHLVAAVDARTQGPQNLDENEHIAVRLFPVDRVFAMIRGGEITAVGTVAGIYLAWDYLKVER